MAQAARYAIGGEERSAPAALLQKLSTFVDLDAEETSLLGRLTADVRQAPAKSDINAEGSRPKYLHLIVEGWAARYRILTDGTRQITAFLMPGDFCDFHVSILKTMDHSIMALTNCKVAWIASDLFDELTAEYPRLTRGLWWCTLLDESILRAWIVNLGRRDAYRRIAHQICELHDRTSMIDSIENGRFEFPITQVELSDATGLTPVHVNRILQRLRWEKLIELTRTAVTIKNLEVLQAICEFDPAYLHMGRRGDNGWSPPIRTLIKQIRDSGQNPAESSNSNLRPRGSP